MPWQQEWFEAPKDMNLPVLNKLPDGVHEKGYLSIGGLQEACGLMGEEWHEFYLCPHCKGWIEGIVNAFPVNNLNPTQLAGRQGTEYYCRRCGKEIGFFGLMS